ncbi:SgcJ/EcaC family oxidoreductase [Marine Group I thaumarchaeote]|jgi:uncharacterized protein (TIGR02246 family)|uniref:Calcium/calmodulin-dependent protein kinase II association-domain domain-containing protein n=1 Tax=uncultured marine crenarchaeote HF4000_ANIW93E5 TaxID=455563 RepID=B3T2N4_9ARCH|nr:hypothetical protein ALOHA_HF4000ANIW93E5ctg6g11 [uncultured marine crenarchaeote HF4000_ANIW93E5]NWJ21582.1 SgcJ/EcaC family oxidoreductase [Marine Group I thaumarchaeote]
MSDSTASELLQEWTSAVKSGDPKQVTSLYRDDGILLGTFSNKERVGHELILEYFENLLKSPVEVQIVSENPHVLESAAVNTGHYNFVTGGKTINARFSFVYHKSNGEWKITSHHSSVMPETG